MGRHYNSRHSYWDDDYRHGHHGYHGQNRHYAPPAPMPYVDPMTGMGMPMTPYPMYGGYATDPYAYSGYPYGGYGYGGYGYGAGYGGYGSYGGYGYPMPGMVGGMGYYEPYGYPPMVMEPSYYHRHGLLDHFLRPGMYRY